MRKITNLGHESWLLETSNSKILIDPLINNQFGTSDTFPFRHFPERSFEEGLFEDINSIILTTEHFQHFDLDSIKMFENVDIYLPNTFSKASINLLKKLNFKIHTLQVGEVFKSRNEELLFIRPSSNCLVWDKRGCSLAISCQSNKDWVYFQSDTLTENFDDLIPGDWKFRSKAAVLTNHKALDQKIGYSSKDNLLGMQEEVGFKYLLNNLNDILAPECNKIKTSELFIVAGGMYRKHDLKEVIFNWSNKKISEKLSEMYPSANVTAAETGLVIDFDHDNNVSISEQISINKSPSIENEREPFGLYPFSYDDIEINEETFKEINEFASKRLLISEFGSKLVFMDEYMNAPMKNQRFVIQLLAPNSSEDWVFDLQTSEFIRLPSSDDDAIRNYPAGIRISKSDFLKLWDGELTVGEIVYSSVVQWYSEGDLSQSPLGFLLIAFSECFSSRMAEKKYNNIFKRLV